MRYRVQLTFVEPYQVDVEADNMEHARRKATEAAFEETGRGGIGWEDVEVEIQSVAEIWS